MLLDANKSKCWVCGGWVRTGHILCWDDWNRLGSPARKRMRRVIRALQPTESKTVIDRVGLDLDLVRQGEMRYQRQREQNEASRTIEAIAQILHDFPSHERFRQFYAHGDDIGHPTTLTVMHFISGLYSVYQTSPDQIPPPPDRGYIMRRPTDEEFSRWLVAGGDHAGSTIPLTHILGAEQIRALRGEGGGK